MATVGNRVAGKNDGCSTGKKTRDHSNGSAAHAPQVRGRGIASKIRQPASSEEKMTLMQAVRYFADRDVCEKYMRSIKWPNDITCPDCGAGGDRIGEVKTRHLLRCKDCRRQISAKVGTIFESSPLGLDKWFVAMWCIANCKNGISSHELARALGVRQPSAWFLLHRIRVAMECGGIDKFDGPGGAAKNMHAKKRREKIKPNGFDKFDYLARKLVTVPKDKVAAKVSEKKAAKPRS